MGRAVAALAEQRGHTIHAVVSGTGNAGGRALTAEQLKGADVAVEFTRPEAVIANLERLIDAGVPTVTGTTGWRDALPPIAERVQQRAGALLHAANFSLGVHLFLRAAHDLAGRFAGRPEFDAFILEEHHAGKLDAPSGTARELEARLRAADAARSFPITSLRAGATPGTHLRVLRRPLRARDPPPRGPESRRLRRRRPCRRGMASGPSRRVHHRADAVRRPAMTRFDGCGTALVTPFTDAGELDLRALRTLVEWQIAEGIDFLVPCGSTGEAQTMDDREREQVVATVVEAAAGRVPVMAGATSNDTRRAVDETRRMCAVGADAILTAAPYYNKPSQEGLTRHFLAVADASTRPVCLYNVPGRSAVNLQPATALRLAEHPNVRGIKEASGDLRQILEILRHRPADFAVLSGDDWLAFSVVMAGGDGLISVTSNEAPGPMTQLVHLARQGDLADARACLYRLLPLMDANFLESNPSPVKAGLAAMGKIRDVLRLPLVPAGPATRDALRTALLAAGAHVR